jgi:hypothetical protein
MIGSVIGSKLGKSSTISGQIDLIIEAKSVALTRLKFYKYVTHAQQ